MQRVLPIIFAIAQIVHSRSLHCPGGWKYYGPAKKCYLFVEKSMNYKNATAYCHDFGNAVRLLRIHDESQNEFVKGNF